MTQERVFYALEEYGPMKVCEIAKELAIDRNIVQKALLGLYHKGIVERTGGVTWHRVYSLRPGALSPEDGRGRHPNSGFGAAGRKRKSPDPDNWWRPCALAELLPFPLAKRGRSDEDTGAGYSARLYET